MSAYSGLLTRVVDEGSDFASIFMMIVLSNFRQLTGALSSFFILTIAGYWCCQGEEIKKGTQNPCELTLKILRMDFHCDKSPFFANFFPHKVIKGGWGGIFNH